MMHALSLQEVLQKSLEVLHAIVTSSLSPVILILPFCVKSSKSALLECLISWQTLQPCDDYTISLSEFIHD